MNFAVSPAPTFHVQPQSRGQSISESPIEPSTIATE
jgi:hypothetical protein